MNLSYAFRLRKCWLLVGWLLGLMWPLAGCVPTSEPVTIAETRVSIPAVTPTLLATATPIATTTNAPALLARWNASAERYELGPVDATTGQEIPGYTPLLLGGSELYTLQTALSPDGRYLAAIEPDNDICEPSGGGSACRAQAGLLHLVDVANWQDTTVALPGAGWVWPIVFNTDSTRLVLAHHTQTESQVLLYDTAGGTELARQTIPFRPGLIAFTGDGAVALAGAVDGENRGVTEPGPFTVQLLEGVTLAEQWTQTMPDIASGSWCTAACDTLDHERRVVSWQPGMVASPDGRFLYIVHADENRLTTVDLHGQAVQTVPIQAAQSWLERLLAWTARPVAAKSLGDGAAKTVVVSPDGNRLYVSGSSWSVETNQEGEPIIQTEHPGLQVVAAADGRLLTTKDTTAERLRITPDGAYLLLDGWGANGRWFEVWQADTLGMITRLDGPEVTAVPLLDGNYALLAGTASGQQLYLSLMAPPRFKCAPIWTADGPITWVTRE